MEHHGQQTALTFRTCVLSIDVTYSGQIVADPLLPRTDDRVRDVDSQTLCYAPQAIFTESLPYYDQLPSLRKEHC